jgi:hypothetical protein
MQEHLCLGKSEINSLFIVIVIVIVSTLLINKNK